MGAIKRQTMKFLVPNNLDALTTSDSSNRNIIPVYINPQNLQIREGKVLSESLTKGGYMIQYWGEQLPEIQASGTTGSGGIEAVNILRNIYRHEQIVFKSILVQRALNAEQVASGAIADTSSATASAGIANILDSITGGGFGNIVDGISSSLDAIVDAFTGSVEENLAKVELLPTLASFAVSIDLFFQGIKYRGFFTTFSTTESANSPGLFEYNFTFKVTRITGQRANFMPWHQNPLDESGAPREASVPTADTPFASRISDIRRPNSDGLSFPANDLRSGNASELISSTQFTEIQDGTAELNNVSLDRDSLVKS